MNIEDLLAQLADLTQRNEELQDEAELLLRITEEAGVAGDPPSVLALMLRSVAERMDWTLGQAWMPQGDTLVRGPAWHEPAADLTTIRAGREDLSLSGDHGAPGRAYTSRQAAWEQGAAVAARFACTAEAMSAVALPVCAGKEVVGVLEFLVAGPPQTEDLRVQRIARVVAQLGTVIRQKQIEVELRQQKDLFESLTAVARATAAGGPTLEATLRNALNVAVQLTQAEYGSLFQLDENGRVTVSILGHSGLIERHEAVDGVMDRGLAGWVVRHAQPALLTDTEQDDRWLALPGRSYVVRSALVVPILSDGQVCGVLSLLHSAVGHFTPGDQLLLQSAADQMALAMNNARLYQAAADEQIRLQALIESSRDGIVLIGTDGLVRVVNGATLRLLCLPGVPDDWLQSPALFAIRRLRAHARPVARLALGEMRRARRGAPWSGQGEFQIGPRMLVWINLPVEAGMTQMGRLLVLRDVTQERQLERMREDLTNTIVHDLRNPLTSIKGALGTMTYLGELHPEMLDVARSGTEQMLRLVNTILDVSRMESGQMPLALDAVALAPLVADLFAQQLPDAATCGVRLESEIPVDFPLLWGDESLIKRVLQNLVANALRYSPSNSALRVAAEVQTSGAALIKVIDKGMGIQPEWQGRLFQKFASTQRAERGTGLGLAFCRLAVEAHGGSIWVESTAAHGTTFSFTLPFKREPGQTGASDAVMPAT